MTDKQKLALKELADVMEKHNILIGPFKDSCLYVEVAGSLEVTGAADLYVIGTDLTTEYIREALKE